MRARREFRILQQPGARWTPGRTGRQTLGQKRRNTAEENRIGKTGICDQDHTHLRGRTLGVTVCTTAKHAGWKDAKDHSQTVIRGTLLNVQGGKIGQAFYVDGSQTGNTHQKAINPASTEREAEKRRVAILDPEGARRVGPRTAEQQKGQGCER